MVDHGIPDPLLDSAVGDSVVHSLRESGLGGDVVPWRDVLHEGPVPGDTTPEELCPVRARYAASRWNLPYEEVLRDFETRDRTLQVVRSGAYLLWLEADLYDQLQLIQVLAMLHELQVPPERIRLISIGEYPDIAHSGGLGELTPAQLVDLSPRGEHLDAETLGLAASAWATFRLADPTPLTDTSKWTSRRLRFLAEPFARLAEEYPWRWGGVSLTQQRILAGVARASGLEGDLCPSVAQGKPAVPGRLELLLRDSRSRARPSSAAPL